MAKNVTTTGNWGVLIDLNNSIYMLTCYLFNYLIVLRRHAMRSRSH